MSVATRGRAKAQPLGTRPIPRGAPARSDFQKRVTGRNSKGSGLFRFWDRKGDRKAQSMRWLGSHMKSQLKAAGGTYAQATCGRAPFIGSVEPCVDNKG